MLPFRKILVPIDFSKHSEHALEVALDLAKSLGASIGIVHVHEPIVWAPGLAEALDAQTNVLRHGLGDLLTDAAAKARAAGVDDIETRLIDGVPYTEIVRCAREANYDLIVIGTHGRRGFDHALMGSVAERVVRTASCAVMTVNLPGHPKSEETKPSNGQHPTSTAAEPAKRA